MKKLTLLAAIVLGSFTTFAQTASVATATTATETVAKPAQDTFKEITADEVPDAVKTALKKAYPDATLDKAYVNAAQEYKLEITVGGQKATVYADVNGNWIKK